MMKCNDKKYALYHSVVGLQRKKKKIKHTHTHTHTHIHTQRQHRNVKMPVFPSLAHAHSTHSH